MNVTDYKDVILETIHILITCLTRTWWKNVLLSLWLHINENNKKNYTDKFEKRSSEFNYLISIFFYGNFFRRNYYLLSPLVTRLYKFSIIRFSFSSKVKRHMTMFLSYFLSNASKRYSCKLYFCLINNNSINKFHKRT